MVVVGAESAGKSTLVGRLTGRHPKAGNFRGTTVSVERYEGEDADFVDTPGILHGSDSETTEAALAELGRHDAVLLVVPAGNVDEDLARLMPLVRGRRGAVAVTFWDRIEHDAAALEALRRLARVSGVAFVPLDAREPGWERLRQLRGALAEPGRFPERPPRERLGWRVQPRATVLERPVLGPALSLALLLLPAILAVWSANAFAGFLDPTVGGAVEPPARSAARLPQPLAEMLAGDYGLITMGPLLFVWAAPTVVLYALLLGAYKASGLLDRLTGAVHPLLRHAGLTGRDLVRVLMGFGCNVPAVINTRSCSKCNRDTCISAIGFGSACSYQLGATLAVFAAAGKPMLVVPFLLYLAATTLVYTRLISGREARRGFLVVEGRAFLSWPLARDVWREARFTLGHFFARAVPIFFAITLVASLVNWLGILDALANILGPIMAAFNLPAAAALPTLLACIRKDGILLFAQGGSAGQLDAVQLLTGVYLAGVLLPCLVTALTVARERSVGFALRLLGRQALAAISFSVLLAWGGRLLM